MLPATTDRPSDDAADLLRQGQSSTRLYLRVLPPPPTDARGPSWRLTAAAQGLARNDRLRLERTVAVVTGAFGTSHPTTCALLSGPASAVAALVSGSAGAATGPVRPGAVRTLPVAAQLHLVVSPAPGPSASMLLRSGRAVLLAAPQATMVRIGIAWDPEPAADRLGVLELLDLTAASLVLAGRAPDGFGPLLSADVSS